MTRITRSQKISQSVVYFTIFILIASCSTVSPMQASDSILYRLKGRGPVVLSTDNPYLAGNLLLSKEMARSQELQGFLSNRGPPAALEVDEQFFGPTKIYLYYPEAKEQYELEDANGFWIIKGPLEFDREKLKSVAFQVKDRKGTPLLRPVEKPTAVPNIRAEEHFQKTTRETAESSTKVVAANKKVTEGKTTSTVSDKFLIESLLQKEKSAPAERTPKGDLVHFITFPGETLNTIARWYTLDASNAARLARINKLTSRSSLLVGDQIVIPAYMIKNKQRLTEAGLRALEKSSGE